MNYNDENPFSISFGREPKEFISRDEQLNQIEKIFTSDFSSTQAYILTGIRGCGKTVSLTKLYDEFKTKKDWITIDLNSCDDLLLELVAKLYDEPSVKSLFLKSELNLSAFGIGINIKEEPPINHISTALEKMLTKIKSKKKRLLICIDEVANTKSMQTFVSEFQILIRHKMPIYLIMTGLYQNVDDLQNEDTLTFLHRTPKIALDNLNILSIANSYSNIFDIDNMKALELAKLTNGYAFAYQLLGFLCYENKTTDKDKVMKQFDNYLTQLVYEKVWTELTNKEREIVKSVAKGNNSIKEIIADLSLSQGTMSTYKIRLTKKRNYKSKYIWKN